MDPGLLDAVMGPIWAALGAIGHKALSDVEDTTADETVRLGQRLLARLLRRGRSQDPVRPALEAAAQEVAADPQQDDFRGALRGQVRKALAGADAVADLDLAADLEGILKAAGKMIIVAQGTNAVAMDNNQGNVSFGDHTTNTVNRYGP
jgi:hypothetical protein